MRKGITPIIAIVLLLLMTIVIVSSASVFIFNIYGGYTSYIIRIIDLSCAKDEAEITFQNTGEGNISISDKMSQIKEYENDANTILLLHFNEEYGDLYRDFRATDSSSNGYHGSYSEAVSLEPFRFSNGAGNDEITIPDADFLETPPLTIEFWLKVNTQGAKRIIDKMDVGMIGYMISITPSDTIKFEVGNLDGVFEAESTTQIIPGMIYHIEATYEWSEGTLYVNGQSEGVFTTSGVPIGNSKNLVILQPGFLGMVDDLRISNMVRSFPLGRPYWGYYCDFRDANTVACDNLMFTKTKGEGIFMPYSDFPYVEKGKIASIRDSGCMGTCMYKITIGASNYDTIVKC